MSTRAIQSELLLAGFRDPVTDDFLDGGSVEFYSAGTTDPKNAWPNKDKTSPATSVTLGSDGTAQMYFDGVYKFIVKNSAGTIKYTLDNLKHQSPTQSVKTITADYTATTDDDVILADTTSGAITITLYPVADSISSLTIKNIGNSSNAITVDGNVSELINGLATASLIDGAAQEYYSDLSQWFGASTTTGTTYTSSNLNAGTNVTLSVGSGITNIDVADASNTTKGAIEIATDAEATTGTSEILAINPKQLKTVQDSAPLTKSYGSTAQTITTGGQLVLPHSLTIEPKMVQYILECVSGDLGYSIGDRICVDFGDSRINTPIIDATNITIRFSSIASCFTVGNKTNGLASAIVNTSWQLYVNAWA